MKLEKSYNTKQYFHSFYRQNHALLVLSFLFTVICFPANLIGSWLLGQVIDAITEVSMNRLRTIILVSIIFIVTMFFFTILLYWVKSNFIRKALIQYKNLAFEKISEKNIAAFSRENTGSYISMLTNDAASIEENYLRKSFLILHYVLLFFDLNKRKIVFAYIPDYLFINDEKTPYGLLCLKEVLESSNQYTTEIWDYNLNLFNRKISNTPSNMIATFNMIAEEEVSGFCVDLINNNETCGYVIIKFVDNAPVISEFCIEEGAPNPYVTLRKSVTSPEWAVFRDDDLLSQWEAFFKKLELKRGFRPAEADLSLNGGGLRIVIVSTNGKEYSFGIWQTSTECIMELGGKFYITNSSDSPFDETYDEAIARHGMTTPWD